VGLLNIKEREISLSCVYFQRKTSGTETRVSSRYVQEMHNESLQMRCQTCLTLGCLSFEMKFVQAL